MNMARRRNRGQNNRQLKKAAQKNTREQRKAGTQSSTVAIESIRQIVELLKPWELSKANFLTTAQAMFRDDAVYSSWESRSILVMQSQENGKLHFDPNNEESVKVAKFLKYCMDNMTTQSARSVAGACQEMLINKWSPFEFVSKTGEGDFSDYHVIDKLSYIHPLSLYTPKPFEIVNGGDKITNINQRNNAFKDTNGMYKNKTVMSQGYKEIDFRKVVYSSYNANPAQPLGRSPLEACYQQWREKELINTFLISGIQRDLAGMPVLRIPQQLFDEAEADPTGPAAATIEGLQENMANLHQGESTFTILPSDTHSENGSGAFLYDFKLQGIDGVNKSFDIPAIIEQKNKAIHKVLAGLHLSSAETGGNSYNSLAGISDIVSVYVKNDSQVIDDMWNKQIFPLLLRLNSMVVKSEDMPRWKGGEPTKLTLEEKGQYFNRIGRFIPLSGKLMNSMLEDVTEYRVDEDLSVEELREMLYDYADPQKNATGQGSSGTGTTQEGGSAASGLNAQNAE
jgi:hypothetical protein